MSPVPPKVFRAQPERVFPRAIGSHEEARSTRNRGRQPRTPPAALREPVRAPTRDKRRTPGRPSGPPELRRPARNPTAQGGLRIAGNQAQSGTRHPRDA